MLQIDGNRAIAGVLVVDIARAMRRQVGMAVLILGDLKFAASLVSRVLREDQAAHPSYRPTASWTKQKRLLGKQGRSQGSSEVEMCQEHRVGASRVQGRPLNDASIRPSSAARWSGSDIT